MNVLIVDDRQVHEHGIEVPIVHFTNNTVDELVLSGGGTNAVDLPSWITELIGSISNDRKSCLKSLHLRSFLFSNDIALAIGNSLIRKCFKLQRFVIEDCEVTNLGMACFLQALAKSEVVEEIQIRDCFTSTSEGVTLALVSMIERGRFLRELDLSTYSLIIEKKDLRMLCEALKHRNAGLRKLTLGRIRFDDCEMMKNMLQENLSLEELILGEHNDYADGVIESIFQGIGKSRSLKVIDIRLPDMGASRAKSIASALKENKGLTGLNLRFFGVQQAVFEYIGEGLQGSSSIRSVTIEAPKLSTFPDSLIPFFQSLKKSRIHELNFQRTVLGMRCMKSLSKSLIDNDSVHSLNLEGCRLDEQQLGVLMDAVAKNQGLNQLNLGHNGINDSTVHHICNALKQNTSVVTLMLGFNDIGDDGLTSFIHMFGQNSTLTVLSLKGCPIGLSEEAADMFWEPHRPPAVSLDNVAKYWLRDIKIRETRVIAMLSAMDRTGHLMERSLLKIIIEMYDWVIKLN
jgi:Ran GTPase-activating protein (RanGAP) involved in mRNA processing and transport